MDQGHSFDAAEFATLAPTAGVPMLDWPSDLFSDNASQVALVAEDFLLQCDPAFQPHAQASEALCVQLAA